MTTLPNGRERSWQPNNSVNANNFRRVEKSDFYYESDDHPTIDPSFKGTFGSSDDRVGSRQYYFCGGLEIRLRQDPYQYYLPPQPTVATGVNPIIKGEQIDRLLHDRATVVVRAWITSDGASDGEASKSLWSDVVIHAFWKVPAEISISPVLKIAYQSTGQGLPKGDATLYLEPFDPGKPEFGWKLVEVSDEIGRRLSRGCPHHVPWNR